MILKYIIIIYYINTHIYTKKKMSTTIIANYWALENNEFVDKGQITLELLDDVYHPYLRIIQNDNIIHGLTIDKATKYEFNNDHEHDILINEKYGLRFDKNSEAPFKIFKEKLESIIKKNLVCEFYSTNNKLKFYGYKNEDNEWDGPVTEYYSNRNKKFVGEYEDNNKISGTFYNKENTLNIIINNISLDIDNNKSIPNGYIKINNQYTILYEDYETKISDLDIDSDTFVNDLCTIYFGKEYMEEFNYKIKVSKERDYINYQKLIAIETELNYLNQFITNKYTGFFGFIRWIFGC